MPFALLTLFVWLGSASCGSPSVRFAVQLYEVHLNLAPDGSVEVHERIALRVGTDAARAFERRVTGERVDGFRDVSASIDGQPATAGGGPGQVTIEPGRNLTVGWLLGPASDASHVLDLRYRATGVVEIQGMRGTFRWQVLPEPRNYDINEARLSLVLPQGTRPLVAPTIDAPGWQWASAPDKAVAVKTAVSHDESAERQFDGVDACFLDVQRERVGHQQA